VVAGQRGRGLSETRGGTFTCAIGGTSSQASGPARCEGAPLEGAFFGAGLTAPFIVRIGRETFAEAGRDLVDGRPPQELLTQAATLAEGVAGVEDVHEIRGRRSGQYVILDLELDVGLQMTVKASHDIAIQVKRLTSDRFPGVGEVVIYINPHDEEHPHLIRL
jgi:divalent metal cation (Fe/Co/Zn/Cd) transporter